MARGAVAIEEWGNVVGEVGRYRPGSRTGKGRQKDRCEDPVRHSALIFKNLRGAAVLPIRPESTTAVTFVS
jgi:hypothetical protein